MEVSGRIKVIGQVQDISASFRKREIVVTTEEQYPQIIMVEFTQDKCDLLNGFQIGEPVKISINLRGREWVNPQGETKYFNSIQGWRIERLQTNVAPPSYQQPNQGYVQQSPAFNQPSATENSAMSNNPFPPATNFSVEEPDDLPF